MGSTLSKNLHKNLSNMTWWPFGHLQTLLAAPQLRRVCIIGPKKLRAKRDGVPFSSTPPLKRWSHLWVYIWLSHFMWLKFVTHRVDVKFCLWFWENSHNHLWRSIRMFGFVWLCNSLCCCSLHSGSGTLKRRDRFPQPRPLEIHKNLPFHLTL